MLAGTPGSELLPECRNVIWSLLESNFCFSVFLFLLMSAGCLCCFAGGIGNVVSFSMVFPLDQLVNRATERMERIARVAMEPVVVFGGAGRGGLSNSSEIGQDMCEIWEASLGGSESWRGDSEAEADRTWAGRSADLEAVLSMTFEPRELKRARDAKDSEGAPVAEQIKVNTPACNNDADTYYACKGSPFQPHSCLLSPFALGQCSTTSPCLRFSV